MTDDSTSKSFSLNSLATAIEPTNQSKSSPTAGVASFPRKSMEDAASKASNASPFGSNFQQNTSPSGGFNFQAVPTGQTAVAFNFNAQTSPVTSRTFTPSNQRGSQPSNGSSPSAGPAQPRDNDETEVPLTAAQRSQIDKKVNTKLRDVKGVVVDRDDPTSPLFSVKTFEELQLDANLLKGIYQMGFQRPSKIQEIVLPILLANPPQNIIAQSQSGTGKTGAFSLTILSRIDPQIQAPQAMILAPTFELAIQIGSVIEQMSRFLPYIKVAYAVRQNDAVRQPTLVRNQLLKEPIVIGTPGTVEDWAQKKKVVDLSQLRIFCVDEADVMIDTGGFQESCMNLVSKLNLQQCLMMLFSATYSDEVMHFARSIVPNAKVFRLKREKQSLGNIRQYFIRCNNMEEKYAAIQQIYTYLTVGQAMIFCRTKATARELNIRMANENHSVRELTGALDIEQRASVIKAFREGKFRVLISTNVTSRGIDIDDVSLVINYDMPVDTKFQPDFETYLHRIGRCGRFGRMGYTFNLIGSPQDMEVMKAIENYFQRQIQEITLDEIVTLVPDIVEDS